MEQQIGEKTEQPTPKKLEEASKKGQIPKSAEIQTVVVLLSAMAAIMFAGPEAWNHMMKYLANTLIHLHEMPVTLVSMQGYMVEMASSLGKTVAPIMVAAAIGGLLAGGMQTRFQATPEALGVKWEKLNPANGIKRVFSFRNAAPSGLALVKLATIIGLTYGKVLEILRDPIFYSTITPERVGTFLADTSLSILIRVIIILIIIAAIDYLYQSWRTQRDLMMTKQEVKDESKNTEANPMMRARQRKRRQKITQRQMMLEVPKADVVVTNPTHLAVALRYDKTVMKAPKIVAKGSRLNALKIREIARNHQVPILENKPLARLMFRHGRVGGEVPAQLYAAVAEIFAWVYRINRYRYYMEENQAAA